MPSVSTKPCHPLRHMALNLEPGVAVTQNFVSASNLPHVLAFLKPGKGRSDRLVSGCESHADRARLHERFVQALERERPEVLVQVRTQEDAKRRKVRRLCSSRYNPL